MELIKKNIDVKILKNMQLGQLLYSYSSKNKWVCNKELVI
jgi:hypothetical protein